MSLWTPHVTRCPSYALTWSTRPLDGHDAYMVRADKSTVRACNKTISNPQTSHQGSSVQSKLVIAFTCRRRRQPYTLPKTRTSILLNCNWLFLLFIFGRFETLRWGWSGCDVPFHVTANWLVGFGCMFDRSTRVIKIQTLHRQHKKKNRQIHFDQIKSDTLIQDDPPRKHRATVIKDLLCLQINREGRRSPDESGYLCRQQLREI